MLSIRDFPLRRPYRQTQKAQDGFLALLEQLHQIAATGEIPATYRKWDSDYGPVHRVADDLTSITGTNRVKLTEATKVIQSAHLEHVVPSTWGTVNDWASVGHNVKTTELNKGVTLVEDKHIPAGTNVYHATQIENYKPKTPEPQPPSTLAIEESIRSLQNLGITTCYAFSNNYSHPTDTIEIIPRQYFADTITYLKTYAHEIAHATGATHRLNRTTLTAKARYADTNYNKEEIIAELTAVMITEKLISYHTPEKQQSNLLPSRLISKSAEYIWRHLQEPKHKLTEIQTCITEAEHVTYWISQQTLRHCTTGRFWIAQSGT